MARRLPYRRALEHWLNAHDVTATIIGYASWGTIIDCVSAGAGMTLAPEGVLDRYTLSAGLTRQRFADLQPIDIRFVWNKEIERHTARDAFAQLLQERLGK